MILYMCIYMSAQRRLHVYVYMYPYMKIHVIRHILINFVTYFADNHPVDWNWLWVELLCQTSQTQLSIVVLTPGVHLVG